MKKIIISLAIIATFILIASCDKVKAPIVSNNTPTNPNSKEVRKVLIEDYTGQKCGNCPPAAATAEQLAKQYQGKVIVIAVHAGDFAKTQGSIFPTSYTTQAGNDWDGTSGFAISSGAGNPNGMVNRKDYQGNGLIQGPSKWSTTTSLALSDTYILSLSLTPNYDLASRILNTTVKAKFKSSYANNTKITLVITEDSIVGPQKDYSLAPNPDIVPNYEFNHMLRGDINGSWGTALKNTPILANDSVIVSFNNFTINSAYNDKHIYLVGFVSDAATKEILQVEQVKIR
jgi:thiol-disulfide isomerase/thioredoxin